MSQEERACSQPVADTDSYSSGESFELEDTPYSQETDIQTAIVRQPPQHVGTDIVLQDITASQNNMAFVRHSDSNIRQSVVDRSRTCSSMGTHNRGAQIIQSPSRESGYTYTVKNVEKSMENKKPFGSLNVGDMHRLGSSGGVSLDVFKNVLKEVVWLKQQLQVAKSSGHHQMGLESENIRLKYENDELKKQMMKYNNLLILDDGGLPMERKEVIFLKEENERHLKKIDILEKRLQELRKEVPTDRKQNEWKHAMESENDQLKQQVQQLRSIVVRDENGRPMEPNQVISLRDERRELMEKVSVLEINLDECRNQLDYCRERHTTPDYSVFPAPSIDALIHEVETLKKDNDELQRLKNQHEKEIQSVHETMNEVFGASKEVLPNLLGAEKKRNKQLEEECNILKMQVETYERDYKNEKDQQRKRENIWDTKFTKIRKENEKLTKQLKQKEQETMQLHSQYEAEFSNKMKIQEDMEKQRHEPVPNPPRGDWHGGASAMASSITSFELNICDGCSMTFNSAAEMENHRKTCGRDLRRFDHS